MNELDALRGEIDAIDAELASLFFRRMEVTAAVGAWKSARGLPVLDPAREREVLEKKAALAADPALKADVTALFEATMGISRRQQRRLYPQGGAGGPSSVQALLARVRPPLAAPRVLYQGEPGAYAEEAAALFFGEERPRARVDTWEDIFSALQSGGADYGVLPIENSSTGGIQAVYDLLAQSGFYIAGEQYVRVSHCLMAPRGTRLEDIREVFSHEQGLLQCAAFLRRHPGWAPIPRLNTAEAAKFVAAAGGRTGAAIGSRRAAALYGLDILAEGISTYPENDTRFVVVSPVPELREGSDKVSLLFTLPHRSGALHEMIAVFAANGLNLLKLESRPIPGRSWEYLFFLDFAGDLFAPAMEGVFRALEEATDRLQILGHYKAGREADASRGGAL